MEFWDLSGDKQYLRFLDVYIKANMNDFGAIIYVFDVSNIVSLSYFNEWITWLF